MSRTLLLLPFVLAFSPALAGPVIVIETTEIVQEVPKPEVAVFISRENLHKSYSLDIRESFVRKILKSVQNQPF